MTSVATLIARVCCSVDGSKILFLQQNLPEPVIAALNRTWRGDKLEALFLRNNHGVTGHERFDTHVAEASFSHPSDAVGRGEVKAAGGHDQHIETGQQASRACAPLIAFRRPRQRGGPRRPRDNRTWAR